MSDQQEHLNLLSVEIGDKDAGRQAYPVRVTLGDGSAESDWLRLAELPPPPSARARGGDLADYGMLLFERLFSGPLLGLFRQAWIGAQRGRGMLHLQLWIKSNAPELQAVPWELMHTREDEGAPIPLAATPQVAFSRYVDSATPFGQPIERWPLRVLVAIGAPNDLGTRWPLAPVEYEAERDRLAAVLDAVSTSGQIEYRFLHPATPEALVRGMEEGYQIVIFYGHGLYAPRLGTSLMMQNADGASRLFAAGDLIAALRRIGSRPALFILISCNTASQRADPALDNLAIQIVRDGSVPAVVAMRDLVEINLARAFTQYLCDYLLRYGIIDRAVAAARRQVLDPDSAGWSTPVLYMRSRDGRLFVPNAQLEFARLLSNDPQIRPAALAAPAGARLALLRSRPDDQPNPRDARVMLDDLLALEGPKPSPAPVVVSGGSRISRSLLLQQWGWQQNRRQVAGGRWQVAGGRWQVAGGRRQAAGGRWQVAGDGAQEAGAGADSSPASRLLPPAAPPPIAVYLPLADDRRLQAGARFEDLLIDAASEIDPAHGVALMNLLAEGKDGGDRRFVLLIDGFEAVGPTLRPTLAELLDTLARRMPSQRIVISVEESEAPPALRRDGTFWLMLCPLSERQIRAYLSYRDEARQLPHLRAIIRGGLRDLAGDPQLLTAITEQLLNGGRSNGLTRDDLLSGLLDRVIERAAGTGASRAAMRECLYALAWALHWSNRRSMPTSEALVHIRGALQDRGAAAENAYRTLVDTGALVEVGGVSVQLSHLDIQAYAAARALRRRPDTQSRLDEIMVLACDPGRMAWWSPVLVGVAQRAESLAELAPVWALLRSEVSGPQAILAARCIGAFLQAQRLNRNLIARLRAAPGDETQLNELLDSILIQLNPRFEPSATSRAMLAEALGQLPYPKVRAALRHQIGARVLLVDDLWQFDRPIVRVAAARALRDMAGADTTDGQIDALLQAWRRGQTEPLLGALDGPGYSAEERALAAFALSDMSDRPDVQKRLLGLLLQAEGEGTKKEWQATQAAIADALILEADDQLAGLLAAALAAQPQLLRRTEILVVNIAGACATHQPALLAWLYGRLAGEPFPLVAGMAQVALARALACGPTEGLPVAGEEVARELEAKARELIEQPITAEMPMVATLRRLAIETLVWLGVTGDGTPPQAISSWPVALRQSWWESVEG